MKNILLFFGVVFAILIAIFILLQNQGKNVVKGVRVEDMILFYSKTCPHCQRVEEFIQQNKVDQKLKFTKIDIKENQQNSDLFIEKATECKIPQGVPLFWDGQKCINGDQPIIDFFQSKLK